MIHHFTGHLTETGIAVNNFQICMSVFNVWFQLEISISPPPHMGCYWKFQRGGKLFKGITLYGMKQNWNFQCGGVGGGRDLNKKTFRGWGGGGGSRNIFRKNTEF